MSNTEAQPVEYWDIYDADRNKTGKTMIRGEDFKENSFHLVIHVCIFNSSGEMLIQQRQPFKKGWSGLWDLTVGGSAVQGENSRTAAERELKEELGIELAIDSRPQLTINFEHGFDDIFLIEKDLQIKDLKLQYEEVKDARWAAKEEILRMIESGEFIPYHRDLIGLLFGMKGRYGTVDSK